MFMHMFICVYICVCVCVLRQEKLFLTAFSARSTFHFTKNASFPTADI